MVSILNIVYAGISIAMFFVALYFKGELKRALGSFVKRTVDSVYYAVHKRDFYGLSGDKELIDLDTVDFKCAGTLTYKGRLLQLVGDFKPTVVNRHVKYGLQLKLSIWSRFSDSVKDICSCSKEYSRLEIYIPWKYAETLLVDSLAELRKIKRDKKL